MSRSIRQFVLTRVVLILTALSVAGKISLCTIVLWKLLSAAKVGTECLKHESHLCGWPTGSRLHHAQAISSSHPFLQPISGLPIIPHSDHRVLYPRSETYYKTSNPVEAISLPSRLQDDFSVQAQCLGPCWRERCAYVVCWGAPQCRNMKTRKTLGFCAPEGVSKFCLSAILNLPMLTPMFKDPVRTVQ
jgi:hypothetical protein